jgi:hypothetical protein
MCIESNEFFFFLLITIQQSFVFTQLENCSSQVTIEITLLPLTIQCKALLKYETSAFQLKKSKTQGLYSIFPHGFPLTIALTSLISIIIDNPLL